MNKFKDLGRKMGKFYCLSLKTDGEYEDCLSGERGEIWVDTNTTCKAFIVTKSKEEKIYTFDIKDLNKWFLKIKRVSLARSIYLANNPNERLK